MLTDSDLGILEHKDNISLFTWPTHRPFLLKLLYSRSLIEYALFYKQNKFTIDVIHIKVHHDDRIVFRIKSMIFDHYSGENGDLIYDISRTDNLLLEAKSSSRQ